MKILVTGGAGYLGSVLCQQLLSNGNQVRVLDNLRYGGQSLLSLAGQERFEFIKGDIRDNRVLKESIFGMEAVVHLAAIVGDPACARNPAMSVDINHKASITLIQEAMAAGIHKMIFCSTCSNYGKMADPANFATEESELHPVSLYAETKVMVEKSLMEMNTGSFAFTILRLATLYGVSPRMRFDLTVNEFAKELLLHHQLVVFGEQFWRPYVHIRDAARAISMVLTASERLTAGQVFNVGSTDENYRKLDLVESMRQQIHPVKIDFIHKDEDPRDYRVSFEKIKKVLGFNISRKVMDGIQEIKFLIESGIITDFENPCFYNHRG